jgi:O-acetyl-ADP-ribose deacetylase (regulator of RNase III)
MVIPGMGTGVGGVSSVDAAEAMMKALLEFGGETGPLRSILLRDLDEAMVKAWEETLKRAR